MKTKKKGISWLILCAMLCVLGVGTLTLQVKAEEAVTATETGMTMEEALDYVDNYDSNLMEDSENFSQKLSASIQTIRGDVKVYGTFLALIPPIIAIVLALITKEVYLSLFVGILSGSLLYTMFHPITTVTKTFDTIIAKLADGWNVGIIIFLVMLGIMVSMMNNAGGSAAYGEWASKHIKSRKGAMLSTFLLGALIFVDDYFNCLTVGSVMRPVTDKNKVSRAKLAYLIDATAAPICIIAPISSWAAAVTSVAPEGEGLALFLKSIPFNFYALLSIVMIIVIAFMKFDYGPMKLHESNALRGDLFTSGVRNDDDSDSAKKDSKGKVIDLVLPVIILIVSCVIGMVYTGGFFDGVDFITAFSDCDASVGLVLGSFIAVAFTFFFYLLRKKLTFKELTGTFTDGFKAMVPAILILTFAWTLGGITMDLGAKVFVAEFVRSNAAGLSWMLPAIVFLIATGLAFATGTSWGTFGILLPIVCAVFPSGDIMM
ncbi:MAG: Na+/H+ antiporter NhaC family protein, partial [Lachnospiraceae bacterium]|nr:Na+/H+ antiporter NhaC family protein [Lachnospiraceae bacterium]